MKEKIIDIINGYQTGGTSYHSKYHEEMQSYGHFTKDGIKNAANTISQLMCDSAIHQMWYFGRWPAGFILITNIQHDYLIEQGFNENQIKMALANRANFK
jgi:hypothetical protein